MIHRLLIFPAALPVGHTWVVVTETVLKLVGAATTTSTLEVVAIEDVESPNRRIQRLC